jgi:hypothetical protein
MGSVRSVVGSTDYAEIFPIKKNFKMATKAVNTENTQEQSTQTETTQQAATITSATVDNDDLIDELEAKVLVLERALDEKTVENNRLQNELAIARSEKSSVKIEKEGAKKLTKETFTNRGTDYRILLPVFLIGNEKYFAEDLLKDEALQELIVNDYPSVVEAV